MSGAGDQLPSVVFVLGGPGAGKGTQCANIVEKFGYVHLSAGDLLRAERKREGSEVGALIESYIVKGEIVPVEITCQLLENAMNDNIKEHNKYNFLIDGFPRNKDNLDGWNSQMGGKANVKFVLFFNCTEDVCVQRIMKRSETSGRSDDNMDSLKLRFNTYVNSTMPIIEHFEKENMVKTMNADQTVEKVFEDVQQEFGC